MSGDDISVTRKAVMGKQIEPLYRIRRDVGQTLVDLAEVSGLDDNDNTNNNTFSNDIR